MQKKSVLSVRVKNILFFIGFILAIVLVAVISNIITDGGFLYPLNIKVIISNAVYPIFIAWALCFLFACGYFDLSLGAIIVLASFGSGVLGNLIGYPGVIIGGVVVGTALVVLNFFIFAFTNIPSWIASISLAIFYEAIAIFLRQNLTTRYYVDAELNANYRAFGDMPANLILLAVGFVVVYLLYNRTSVGLNIRSIGGNAAVTKALGVNRVKTLMFVGLICGLLIGIASFVQESYNIRTTVMPSMTSVTMVFKPLAIALLAQILQKRINIIIGVPFCAVIIYGIFNLMTFFGVPSGTLQDVFLMIFLTLFGVLGQRGVKEVVK